ncbi:chitinase-like protein PB1E7.04c [Astyanax mexicanus]|uniref:Chitinase-like protein PB1E7.04c n=1 Tax=Astyanax mexicanus TaxID=7994 RepID=A0A8T2KUU7_ASTMX|nr:chitinase-like protein PB1E7.04c [Astyanax mexicanus]
MMFSGNRILFLSLALFIWRNANGLGVWQNRPANYWQSGGVSKSFGDTALSPAQQGFSSSASGVQTAVGDVGSAQPLTTSASGDSVANVPGFLRQYSISQAQNVLSPQSTANQASRGFQNQLVSSPVSSAQSSASQSLSSQQSSLQSSASQSSALQQSSLQLASPSQGTATVPGVSSQPLTQTQPSRPVTVPLSVASDFPTTSQQASPVSQSAAGTLYGQPSSWYSFTQGQTPSQSVTTSYKPVSLPQGSTSQSFASQQSSLQLGSPSLGTASVPAIQMQSSSPVTSTLSLTSNLPTSSQAQTSYVSQSATDPLHGHASSLYSSRSADAPNTLGVAVIGVYTAGPAQWYRVDPFGRTSQINVLPSPSQATGSLGSQAASSSSTTTSQTQSTTGSVGFGFQSQSAPASTVSLTQGAAQLPTLTQGAAQLPTLTQAANPSASVSQPSQGEQSSWRSSGVSTSFGQSSSGQGGLSLPLQSTANQAALGFQNQLVSSPVSSAPSSASQSLSSQQSSLQFASPGQATSSLPQSFTANYVFGTQTQPSSPGTVSLSVASDFPTTSQQASSGSQSAVGTLYAQPSNWYSFTLGQAPSQSATASYKPVSQSQSSTSQSSASQSSALQQSSLQLASPSQGTATVPGIQVQTSSPVTSTLSLASNLPTTSQQATSGSQLATGTLYGQPSSWFSSTQGQSFQTASQFGASQDRSASSSQGSVSLSSSTLQTPSQFQATPYKPVLTSQGSASQSLTSQQSSLQVTSPSQGVSSQPLTLSGSYAFGTQTQPSRPSVTTSYKPVSLPQGSASQSFASQQSSLQLGSPSLGTASVPAIQMQSSSPVTSTLSLTSNLPTSSQAQTSYVFQSATDPLHGQASSLYSSTQGQGVQIASRSADAPNTLGVAVIGVYTAGPAQWYRVDPFGRTSQINVLQSPSQATGSLGSQAASSSSTTTSQSQSTTGSVGFGFQSQSAPASTSSLTQGAAQLPTLTQGAAQLPTFTAANPSASVSQPSQGEQSSWRSSGVSTSFGQSSSGQVAPVATTQQFSSGWQGPVFSGTFPSQSASTSPSSGSYGSTFQSRTTQVGSFDQFSQVSSPLSVASTFTKGIPTSFGLLQGYSSQPIDFRPATQRGNDFLGN